MDFGVILIGICKINYFIPSKQAENKGPCGGP